MREFFHGQYGARGSAYVHLPGISGREFEQLVYDHLASSLSAQQSGGGACQIILTPRSADRGRDIVIEHFSHRRLFAFDYSSAPRTILIECKIVGKERLSLEHLAANLLQLEHHPSAAFLLVTNATLTPRSIALAYEQCKRLGVHFHLIDAYNLLEHIPPLRALAARGPSRIGDSSSDGTPQLQVSYQALPDIRPDAAGYTIHVVIRSFGTGTFHVGARLHSTRAWTSKASGGEDIFPLVGEDLACFTLRIRPKGAKLAQSAVLVLSVNGSPELVNVSLAGSEHRIDLPLFGGLVSVLNDYEQLFYSNSAPFVLHLHAPSGTGKTRFIQEMARRVGRQSVMWFRVRDDGVAIVENSGINIGRLRLLESVSQSSMVKLMQKSLVQDKPHRLIIVDDLHLASASTFDALEKIAFAPVKGSHIILAGRTDPAVRQPRYEAFAHILAENGGELHKALNLSELEGGQVAEIIASLIPDQKGNSISRLANTSLIKPIEVVHYIHSLLERGYINWIDEDKLGVQSAGTEILRRESDSPTLASEVLGLRLEFLDTIKVGGAALSDIFAVLALRDDPQLTSKVLRVLRGECLVSGQLLSYWFREDSSADLAFLAHDTIAERLIRRCYQFRLRRDFDAVLRLLPFVQERLGPAQESVINLHAGNFKKANTFLASIAKHLRSVRNITSLPLAEDLYHNIGALIFLLENRQRPCPTLFCRAVIARAYINMHCQSFAEGLLDCLELLEIVRPLEQKRRADHIPAAIRQLIAHGLLNSGDLRTALSLMHDVENLLPTCRDARIKSAIEFDLCDRLQSYYTQQSAFELARRFFLRGRSCAYRSRDQTLVSISLSAEFHLFRYLDIEAGIHRALQQVKHAEEHAPLRQQMHAKVNHLVALWNRQGGAAPEGILDSLGSIRATCQSKGYAHLVPRIYYLEALDAYHRYEASRCSDQEFRAMLQATRYSALYYGYGEYLLLCDNLSLLHSMSVGQEAAEVTRQAEQLVRDLERAGLTFIAGKYLCYNTVVVLSNALHAVYTYSDEATAWRISERVRFSPLLCPTQSERERLLEITFRGGLLCEEHDSAAVAKTAQGYFTILA